MTTVLLALIPDFTLIALGGLLRHMIPAAGWAGIDKLNYWLLFPVLIFLAANSRPPLLTDLALIAVRALF